MSTPTGSSVPETKDVDRRRSLGKYVKRMSSVFKKEKSPKSVTSEGAPASSSKAAQAQDVDIKEEETTTTQPAPAAAIATTTPTPAPATVAATPSTKVPPPGATTQQLNRSALQQERARALFAKYGLTLESHEWISAPAQPTQVQRVEKPIRMRVHRTCHHCETTFGPDKICSKCEHKRCKRCPRYPKQKSPLEKGKEKEAAEKPKKKKKLLTVTTKSGEERVYQPIKQRVRRSCHRCQGLFIPPTATVCEGCRHIRCTKCPREPAKLDKWPNGYPGDVEPESETEVEREHELELAMARRIWRKPRTRVRWECDNCQSQFIEGSPQCPGCGHERCEKCVRKPLKRVKKEISFDPEVIRQVEAKLKALAVEDDTATSSAEAT
ncbi:hypothetical protein BU24DRAFT_340702 [Aaosphaeria arxii CBS 175.79]|uniref:Uncharacterized protein n=1 Tax=Aaosphaeria arxii CBS 175.79 TaxID=1450172 RepID=A0A6A5Y4Y4_9PLEO|nr:uncharacterized protein BU24DRAFT_340702 [Aaosphaeria arxii CBS 175.79]KAF2020097.1 hypothetical protein BU24DRAFT_340702 [Aaosphaeria arxii CBS 175.79]